MVDKAAALGDKSLSAGKLDAMARADISEAERDFALLVAVKLTGDHDLAEDVCQDALIRARDGLIGGNVRNRRAFLRKVVVRCGLNALRDARRRSPDAAEQPADESKSLDVRMALEALDPENRAILMLAYGEDLEYKEIGEVLEIPIGTVASRIHRAKQKFARIWNEE